MTARPQSPVPGLFYIPNGIPDLGISAGDFLHVDPNNEYPYAVVRIVSHKVMVAILCSPGIKSVPGLASVLGDEWCEPFAVKGHGTKADEIDVDALLAGAGTVPEPSADLLLWRFAWGGYKDLHDIPSGAFVAWHRHLKWRDGPGRRTVCRDCDTVFVRDRKNGQRCTNCRVTYRRTCVGCGEAFAALHHAFKRCPPCRERRR